GEQAAVENDTAGEDEPQRQHEEAEVEDDPGEVLGEPRRQAGLVAEEVEAAEAEDEDAAPDEGAAQQDRADAPRPAAEQRAGGVAQQAAAQPLEQQELVGRRRLHPPRLRCAASGAVSTPAPSASEGCPLAGARGWLSALPLLVFGLPVEVRGRFLRQL